MLVKKKILYKDIVTFINIKKNKKRDLKWKLKLILKGINLIFKGYKILVKSANLDSWS